MSNINETTLIGKIAELLDNSPEISFPVSCDRLDSEKMSLIPAGGEYDSEFLDGGRLVELPLLILVKSLDEEKALDALFKAINVIRSSGIEEIAAVKTAQMPKFADRSEEASVFEAQVKIRFYNAAQ